MKTSEAGLEFISIQEGERLKVYKDSAGYPTIGVGHKLTQTENASGKITIAGQKVRWGDGLTHMQVEQLLAQDIRLAENFVSSGVKIVLNQHRFDVLVDFTFNLGGGAFLGSTLLKLLNRGLYADVPAQLRRWVYAGGRVNKGLQKRREDEIKLWNTED